MFCTQPTVTVKRSRRHPTGSHLIRIEPQIPMNFPYKFDPTYSTDCTWSAKAQPAVFRQALVAKLNGYKAGLLADFRDESEGFLRLIRLAINEAEGLAWSTPYAHLLLPALAEEKIQCVRRWTSHQHRVSPGLLLAPAAASEERSGLG